MEHNLADSRSTGVLDRDVRRKGLALFDRVVDLAEGERRAVLLRECGGNTDLLNYIERLLQVDEQESSRVVFAPVDSQSTTWVPNASATAEMTHARIGPYRIVDTLGAGGMGVVYLAEQSEPVVRLVAVKVVRSNLSKTSAVARFEAERQAMARMSHINVAQMFEASTTEEGWPYFVMEYIQGTDLIDYCDENRLGLNARLQLLMDVCRGVQHAHQRGVMHRDLKPANVLVTEHDGRPIPKVIDFGIAKALDGSLSTQSELTGQAVIGTPAYMSPESLNTGVGAPGVDTRTDVYALGVMLYELIAGAKPFDDDDHVVKLLMRIAHKDAPRASARYLALDDVQRLGVATRRRTDANQLARTLHGDLDWIAARALARDPDERYPSASELAADLARYLGDRVVEARPPSLPYRARKFARRNRGLVTALAAVWVALVVGFIGTAASLVAATAARLDAEIARVDADSRRLIAQAQASEAKGRHHEALLQYMAAQDLGTSAQREAAASADLVAARVGPSRVLPFSPELPFHLEGDTPFFLQIRPDGYLWSVDIDSLEERRIAPADDFTASTGGEHLVSWRKGQRPEVRSGPDFGTAIEVGDPVESVVPPVASSDGRWLAAPYAGGLRVLEIATGRVVSQDEADLHLIKANAEGGFDGSSMRRGLFRWSPDDGLQYQVGRFTGMGRHPTGTAFLVDPDGLVVFELATGARFEVPDAGGFSIKSVVVAPPYAFPFRGNQGTVLNYRTGEKLHDLTFGVDEPVRSAAFSVDRRTVAVAVARDLIVLDVETGAEVHRYTGHHSGLSEVFARPNGEWLTVSGADNRIRTFAPPRPRRVASDDCGFTPRFLSASEDDRVHVLSPEAGRGPLCIVDLEDGVTRMVDTFGPVRFSGIDDRTLASFGPDELVLYDAKTGEPRGELPRIPGALVDFTPEFSVVQNNSAVLHMDAHGEMTAALPHRSAVYDVESDGPFAAITNWDRQIDVVDTRTLEVVRTIDDYWLPEGADTPLVLTGPGVSAAGGWLATRRANGVDLYSLTSDDRTRIEVPIEPYLFEFSLDGTHLMLADITGRVMLVRLQDQTVTGDFSVGDRVPEIVNPTRYGDRLMLSFDGEFQVWDVASGRPLAWYPPPFRKLSGFGGDVLYFLGARGLVVDELPEAPPGDHAAALTNLRVCRGDFRVVPVAAPVPDDPWASEEACD